MKFHIVISTIDQNKDHLDKVLKSIDTNLDVIVVYANQIITNHKRVDDHRIDVHIEKNLYEYTAWLGVDYLIKNGTVDTNDWFLMTHDTTLFTEDSSTLMGILLCALHNTPIEFYSLVQGGFHNISMCRKSGIALVAAHFHTVETMTKDEARKYETKLVDFLSPSVVGEHMYRPFVIDQEFIPGKKTSFFKSVGLFKAYI
jgi:hypothetical protein